MTDEYKIAAGCLATVASHFWDTYKVPVTGDASHQEIRIGERIGRADYRVHIDLKVNDAGELVGLPCCPTFHCLLRVQSMALDLAETLLLARDIQTALGYMAEIQNDFHTEALFASRNPEGALGAYDRAVQMHSLTEPTG